MNFDFSEDQKLLQKTARDFLAEHSPLSVCRDVLESDQPYSQALWKAAAEMGYQGTVIPEEYGGAGLDSVDLAVLLEETGRVLLPVPYFSTAVVGARLLLLAGSETQRRTLLPKIAAGEIRVAFAQLEAGGSWSPDTIAMTATPTEGRYVLDGRKLFVPDGGQADLLLVAARSATGPTLFLVESETEGVDVRSIDYIDATRPQSEIVFTRVALEGHATLGEVGGAAPVLEAVHDYARAALCAEMCGGAQQVLDMSVSYAGTREQFGVPIGSFQGLKHRAADMFCEVELSKSVVLEALTALDEERDADEIAKLASLAKTKVGETFTRVSREGVQMHGGIGMTDEFDIGFFIKRSAVAEQTFGDVNFHRNRYGELEGY